MRIRIWGCRGSLPSPGPDTVKYGGNTSCVEVRLDDGTVLVLDAGTGIRPLGQLLEDEGVRTVHLLLTHLHLDHLVGLGFFQPLFTEGIDVHVWGPPSSLDTLEVRISRYLSPPLFPIHLSEVQSFLHVHDAPVEPWTIGNATVTAELVSHAGPTLGFRIEHDGASLAYLPDHEPALGADLASLKTGWLSGYRIGKDADVMLHDAQYTDEEYDQRVGWGHSSVSHAVTLASRLGVKNLVLFHHDPVHTDEELETMLGQARRLWPGGGKGPVLAREGMEFVLSSSARAATGTA